MNRYEQAVSYHHKGFNCAQAVLASYTDLTGLSEQASFDAVAGFGAGLQTGQVCGAISGAVLTLGFLTPVDPQDPVGSKQRTGRLAREFQKRFREKFGDLQCKALLKTEVKATGDTPTAQALGLTNRCDILIISAMEILEEMRHEQV